MDYGNRRIGDDNTVADYSTDRSIRRGPLDIPFFLLVVLLMTIGVVMLLSASYARAYYNGSTPTYYFTRQLIFAALGMGAMIFLSHLPMGFYKRFSMPLLAVSILLLLLVLPLGSIGGGSRRWIGIGDTFSIQPSEIAKVGVILGFATMICKYKSAMKTFRYGVMPFAVILITIVILLVLEPHLSASIIILLLGATMMFLGGTKLYWFAVAGVAGAGGILLYINFFGYASERISAWLDPLGDTSDTAYQIAQSLYSIGSGGLTGLGLGMSRQKYLYLPEEHNDFIFSIICEEIGFIGAMVILVLFAMLIIRGYYLAMHAKDRYSFLVCAGITTMLALQVILNVCVVTNLIPCTGVSLPFFSSGGTALVIQLGAMGIILSMSRDIPAKKIDARSKTDND